MFSTTAKGGSGVLVRIIGVAALLILSYLVALMVVHESKVMIVAGVGLLSVILLLKNPSYTFVIGFVVLVSGFGLLKIPIGVSGLFKKQDIGMIIMMIGGFVVWLRFYYKQWWMFSGRVSRVILVFVGYIILQMVLTSIFYEQSFQLSLQMARYYFSIMLYFACIPIFMKYKKWGRMLKLILVVTFIGSFLYVFQRAFNVSLLAGLYRVYATNTMGDEVVERMSSGITGPNYLAGSILLVYLLAGQIVQRRIMAWILFAFISLMPVMTFTRGYMICYFIQLFITVVFAPIKKANKIRFSITWGVLGVLLITAVSLIRFGDYGKYIGLITGRLYSAQKDFSETSGTYSVRDEILQERMALVMQSPVIGIGFIHPDAGLFPEFGGYVATGHQGYATLFTQFGFLGFGIFVILTLIIFMEGWKVLKMDVPFIYKAFALAAMGDMVQGYPHMLSTSGFISFRSFAYIAIYMAVLQVGKLECFERMKAERLEALRLKLAPAR